MDEDTEKHQGVFVIHTRGESVAVCMRESLRGLVAETGNLTSLDSMSVKISRGACQTQLQLKDQTVELVSGLAQSWVSDGIGRLEELIIAIPMRLALRKICSARKT